VPEKARSRCRQSFDAMIHEIINSLFVLLFAVLLAVAVLSTIMII
jgi:hypothetical protein